MNTYKVFNFFQSIGVKKNDRVAAYLPNIIESVESFLATSAIGAIWSSCSPDFGTLGVIERFSQIKPKILIIADRYYYNGKEINIKDLALLIADVSNYKGKFVYDKSKPNGTMRKLIDSSKIFNLKWKPKISLKSGIKLIVKELI